MYYVIGAIAIFVIYRKLTAPKVEHVSIQELHNMMKDKSVKRQYVDVRTSNEFNSHKIKGFKNMPLQTLRGKLSALDPEQPIVLICASGSRSMSAARVLSKAGYKNLINVKGGIR